jgi:hypothetical protein
MVIFRQSSGYPIYGIGSYFPKYFHSNNIHARGKEVMAELKSFSLGEYVSRTKVEHDTNVAKEGKV